MSLILALASCASSSPRPAVPPCAAATGDVAEETVAVAEVSVAVGAVLDDWHAAAAEADEERYFAHFAPGGVFLGTDATERWDVAAFRAYAHPHFAEGDAWTFRATRREVRSDSAGDIAWFDEDLETENLGPARGSGVLVRGDDGVFRIAHYNLTITIPNARFQEVREVLRSDPSRLGPRNGGESASTRE